jgi:p-aminobenzoyl-glutamate transporter AbgT
MKLTKTQLKRLIKEELENIQEVDVESMSEMEKVKVILDAFVQMGINFSPGFVAGLVILLVQQYGVSMKETVAALRDKLRGSGDAQ